MTEKDALFARNNFTSLECYSTSLLTYKNCFNHFSSQDLDKLRTCLLCKCLYNYTQLITIHFRQDWFIENVLKIGLLLLCLSIYQFIFKDGKEIRFILYSCSLLQWFQHFLFFADKCYWKGENIFPIYWYVLQQFLQPQKAGRLDANGHLLIFMLVSVTRLKSPKEALV